MTPDVVDSSVVIKWFVPEVLSAEAIRLRDSGRPLHAPDFLDVEVTNIAWKKIRRGVMSRTDGDFIISQLPFLPLIRHPTGPLVPVAFDLADRTARTVYDCLYLALAVQLGGQMVTADERLVNALASTPWAGNILRLQDVP
jgi:predicted nucleic acid-binding protein